MKLIDIPTEQTTAATDAVLAVMALLLALYLRRIGRSRPFKTGLWVGAFLLLTLSAALGAVVHGIALSEGLRAFLWHPLYLSLGLLVALFLVAAIYDVRDEAAARRLLPFMLIVGLLFFGITLLIPGSFLVFIVYEAVAMLLAFMGYLWIAVRGRLRGAWLMAAGILVTMIAAGVQAGESVSFTLVWAFDHNGAFHLIQMPGIVLIALGLSRSLRTGA
jgi:hypothetical protein